MSIRATCPGCGAAYTVPETAVGKRTRCRKCDQKFVVGAAPPAADDLADPAAPAPPLARGKRRAAGWLPLYLAAGGCFLCLAAVASVIVASVVVGGGLWRFGVPQANGVTEPNFARLKFGMSLDEVQAILGRGSDLPGEEFPAALQERLDDPEVKGKIDLVEAHRWCRWVGPAGTLYVGLSATRTGDRVTVLALDRPGGLKLECDNTFPGGHDGPPDGVADNDPAKRKPGDDRHPGSDARPTADQLRNVLTRENVAKLQKGMTPREVSAVLGPSVRSRVLERHAGFESVQMTWQVGQTFIIAVFQNGRLDGWDSGDGNGGPLPAAAALAPAPMPPGDGPPVAATYKRARLEKVLLDYHGTAGLDFELSVGDKKIQLLPWEHVKFFDTEGKEIPQGRWGPYLREGKTVLDVTTIRLNVPQYGGEVELIKEWRIVEP